MTVIHWASAIDGAFAEAADWSGGVVPGAADDAVLDAAGPAFTVTSSANETVNGVQIVANATLAITAGTFAASAGTDGGVNAGRVTVTNGAQFVVGGAIDNAGGITLTAASMFLEKDTTLSGGGVVSLVNHRAANASLGGAGRVTLTNIDNTIGGNGVIGATPGFHLVNEAGGVIENTERDRNLTLGKLDQPGLVIDNLGVLESLQIYDAKITGQGGHLIGGDLINCTVTGQTLVSGCTLQDCDVRTHGGVLNDIGIRQLGGQLILEGATMLTGGGDVYVAFGGALMGANAGVSLTNADTRLRLYEGSLGGGTMSLTNQSAGYIMGYGGIDTGANTIINDGVILAYGSPRERDAPLVIASPIDNTGSLETGYSGGGSLIAEGAVTGGGEVTIRGVNGRGRGGGLADFESSFNENVTFVVTRGRAHHGYSPVSILELAYSQDFTASISGFSKRGYTGLDLVDIDFVSQDEATFSGRKNSGVLTVTDGTHTATIALIGHFLGSTFTATSDGHGGTLIVNTTNGSPAQHFAAAMATLGAAPSGAAPVGQSLGPDHAFAAHASPTLAGSRPAFA